MNKIYPFLISLLILISAGCDKNESQKPNVLFICVDDLRSELGCYGDKHIISPNIDKLSDGGFIFKNHFVNVPTCGASRHCLLTGMLPATKDHLRNHITIATLSNKPETDIPESFVHQLKRNNYYTVGIGKISHQPDGFVYGKNEEKTNIPELPYSWNEVLFNDDKWGSGQSAFFGYADGSDRYDHDFKVYPYEKAIGGDNIYVDGLTAELAVKKLQELSKLDQPFFLGVGFFKPHLPFTAPEKYWDLYDESKIPLADFTDIPFAASAESLHNSGEFNRYGLTDEIASLENKISDDYAKKLRHAYFACISYVDAQVGKLLIELEILGLAENTIVVLWGDHGWHLGDHRVWGKHTIFEKSLKSALIVKVPGMEGGKNIDKIVSTTDIYPTLLELCEVETNYKLDGNSLVELLHNPESKQWRNTAYSYFRNGISLRTEKYRLNKYFRKQTPFIELYDHQNDPNETINIAAGNDSIIERLMPVWDLGNTNLYNTELPLSTKVKEDLRKY